MAKPKGGLGRGLDSLFADTGGQLGEQSREITTLALAEIEPNPEQPRKAFKEESISELSDSIRQHGLLQPIAVRPGRLGRYEIIAGERRWRAAQQAGLTEVPVIIKDVTDQEAMELALIENLQREDLDPIEQAEGFEQLLTRCGLTQEQAAARLGVSRTGMTNSLRLLGLPPAVRQWVKEGRLSTGHAKVLLSLDDAAQIERAAAQVLEQALSVRRTEDLCKKIKRTAAAGLKGRQLTLKQESSLPTEVEASLREITGNEIKVKYKKGRGTLTVHFYSDEQLRAFANLLGEYKRKL